MFVTITCLFFFFYSIFTRAWKNFRRIPCINRSDSNSINRFKCYNTQFVCAFILCASAWVYLMDYCWINFKLHVWWDNVHGKITERMKMQGLREKMKKKNCVANIWRIRWLVHISLNEYTSCAWFQWYFLFFFHPTLLEWMDAILFTHADWFLQSCVIFCCPIFFVSCIM